MMKTSLSKQKKMLASSSWRSANANNTREEQNLQKEKRRLLKQFRAETCQLKAAQTRFELQYRKTSTTETKTSLVLPPLHEKGRGQFLKTSDEMKSSIEKSLSSLPRLADSLSTETGTILTRSVSSAAGFHPTAAEATCRTDADEETATKCQRRRSKSYAGLPNVTSMR